MSDDNVSVGGAERASESDSRHPADGDPYTTAHTLTAEQREIMRHTLGYGRPSPPGWRNHFVAGPGSTDYDNCEALVAAGLMAKRSGGPLSGGDPVYRVTDAGMDALVGRKTPNVRAKRATAAGRQARAGENVPRTARPGLVACRWRSA